VPSSSPPQRDPVSELPAQAADEFQTRLAARLHQPDVAEFDTSLFTWPSHPAATEYTSLDWIAFPERVNACLGRRLALHLLDTPHDVIGEGGRSLQEEYAEWRVARGPGGITDVEITIETADYWRILAAHSPERVVELVGEFSSKEEPDVSLIYGALDPFAPGVTVSSREAAFADTMLAGGRSSYNNGAQGIVCMVHPDNSMTALLRLAVAACTPFEVTDSDDGPFRSATCLELAPRLKSAAQLGRASDPLIVERLARLAFEGRRVSLDFPAPLSITGIESSRLRTPSGKPVPPNWFRLSRPMRPDRPQAPRHQRVSLQVPQEERFCVSDLTDVATGEAVASGGQVADLVQISLHLLGSATSDVHRVSIDVSNDLDDLDCEDIRRKTAKHEGVDPS